MISFKNLSGRFIKTNSPSNLSCASTRLLIWSSFSMSTSELSNITRYGRGCKRKGFTSCHPPKGLDKNGWTLRFPWLVKRVSTFSLIPVKGSLTFPRDVVHHIFQQGNQSSTFLAAVCTCMGIIYLLGWLYLWSNFTGQAWICSKFRNVDFFTTVIGLTWRHGEAITQRNKQQGNSPIKLYQNKFRKRNKSITH